MTEATNSPLAGFVVGSLTGIATYGTLSEAELEVVNNVKRPQQLGNVGESGSSTKLYSPVEYKGSVKVNGEVRDVSRRVYQRNDIDINYYDEVTGLTNLERMQAGKPPIGSDGKPIQLYHILQRESGPMVEIRETTHRCFCK